MDLPGNDRLSYCQMKVGVALQRERESEEEGGIDCGLLVVVENEST